MSDLTPKKLFERDDVKQKFADLLGKRSSSFMTSVLQIVSQNELLAKADPQSIYHSACVAATLDLPLNQNLGFAYIVPYGAKQKDGTYKQVAQFQMGYKGFIQLSQRSGQFRTINCSDVREGEIKSKDRLTGDYTFAWIESETERLKAPVIGYVAYFELLNGFSKMLYMSTDQLRNHGTKFSQTFKKGYGLWKDDFENMASKTVLKLLLSKFAPLSVEMQKSVIVDQAIINDEEGTNVEYTDHEEIIVDKEAERIQLMIGDCKTQDEVDQLQIKYPDFDIELFAARKEELRNGSK